MELKLIKLNWKQVNGFDFEKTQVQVQENQTL